ncbi:MAG: glycosyltransferase, partial [Candidatus Aenigmatarchaeota archaeon]
MLDPTAELVLTCEILIFICLNSLWLTIYLSMRKKEFKKGSFEEPISVLIPAYNKESTVGKVIESVLALDYPEKEIIVINDGSTDKTLEICRKFEKEGKIKLISYSKNKGKAFALNTGVKASSHDIIVTVDADSFPKKKSLKKLVKYFVDPEVGAVAGTVKVLNKNKLLTLPQSLEYLHQGFQRVCQGFLDAIMVAPGPLTAYRKEALAKAGYFDDDTSVEDFDMTIKIHKAGYKVISERKAEVLTIAPESFNRWWKQRVRWSRGGLQILRKHFDVFSNKNTRKLAYFSFPLHV